MCKMTKHFSSQIQKMKTVRVCVCVRVRALMWIVDAVHPTSDIRRVLRRQ